MRNVQPSKPKPMTVGLKPSPTPSAPITPTATPNGNGNSTATPTPLMNINPTLQNNNNSHGNTTSSLNPSQAAMQRILPVKKETSPPPPTNVNPDILGTPPFERPVITQVTSFWPSPRRFLRIFLIWNILLLQFLDKKQLRRLRNFLFWLFQNMNFLLQVPQQILMKYQLMIEFIN